MKTANTTTQDQNNDRTKAITITATLPASYVEWLLREAERDIASLKEKIRVKKNSKYILCDNPLREDLEALVSMAFRLAEKKSIANELRRSLMHSALNIK